jgi:hypothetical protein
LSPEILCSFGKFHFLFKPLACHFNGDAFYGWSLIMTNTINGSGNTTLPKSVEKSGFDKLNHRPALNLTALRICRRPKNPYAKQE